MVFRTPCDDTTNFQIHVYLKMRFFCGVSFQFTINFIWWNVLEWETPKGYPLQFSPILRGEKLRRISIYKRFPFLGIMESHLNLSHHRSRVPNSSRSMMMRETCLSDNYTGDHNHFSNLDKY